MLVMIRIRKYCIASIFVFIILCCSLSGIFNFAYAESCSNLDNKNIYDLCKLFTESEILYGENENSISDYQNYIDNQFQTSN